MDKAANEKHAFCVETDLLSDVLLRLLDPFAVLGARLTSVRHERTEECACTRIETQNLAADRADFLKARLEKMPWVRGVEVTCDGSNMSASD
jgi:hypothetical protein